MTSRWPIICFVLSFHYETLIVVYACYLCVRMNLCGRQCKCSMNMTFVCWMIIIIVMQRDVKSSECVVSSSWYESKKAQQPNNTDE